MSLSEEFLLLIPNHHKVVQEWQNGTSDLHCLPYIYTCRKNEKMDRNRLRKKAFKINAKLEYVGLNEDLKSMETLNFHDKLKSQNPTYCFSILHRIKIKQYHM